MLLRDYAKFGIWATRLSEAILNDSISQTYIFESDASTDKRGFAIAFAKAVLCENKRGYGCDACSACRRIEAGSYEDLYITEPEKKNGGRVASVRDEKAEEVQVRLKSKPRAGERNIAVIDGADTITQRAQNRLLKTLEEPAPGTVIILLSENSENLLPTIRSRAVICKLNNARQNAEIKDSEPNNPENKLARGMLSAVESGITFAEMKRRVSSEIKDRESAQAFLNYMEILLARDLREAALNSRDSMGDETEDHVVEKLTAAVGSVEEARTSILKNVSYQYMIRRMLLKLEEIYNDESRRS